MFVTVGCRHIEAFNNFSHTVLFKTIVTKVISCCMQDAVSCN